MDRAKVLCVGIDFGTTYTSVWLGGARDRFMAFETGADSVPTLFAFHRALQFGDAVRALVAAHPARAAASVVTEVKRFLGRTLREEQVRRLLVQTQNTVRDAASAVAFVVRNAALGQEFMFDPTDVAALVLMDVMRVVEQQKAPGEEVRAVVTVPAMFGKPQVDALRTAAALAGVNLVGIVKEPAAAALGYDLAETDGVVLVVDFGGGTLDVAAVASRGGGACDVLHTDGDCFLGGNNVDYNLAELVLRRIEEGGNARLHAAAAARRARLVQVCEAMKVQLAKEYWARRRQGAGHAAAVAELALPFEFEALFPGCGDAHADDEFDVSYAELVAANRDVFARLRACVCRAADALPGGAASVGKVLMVGGMCGFPEVARVLADAFGEARVVHPHDELQLLVCKGAARFCEGRRRAGGAAARVGDVLTHNIGVRHFDVDRQAFFVETLLPRNTRLPARASERCETIEDFQQAVEVELFEDEAPLGAFRIENIPQRKAHTVEVEVVVAVDEEGELAVTASVVRPQNVGITGGCVVRSATAPHEAHEARAARLRAFYEKYHQ